MSDSLVQAQLARVQAIVSLYQALGGGWEPRVLEPKILGPKILGPRVERPVNAL